MATAMARRGQAKADLNGTWLSQNKAAICQKNAIHSVEANVVTYANHVMNGTGDAAMQQSLATSSPS